MGSSGCNLVSEPANSSNSRVSRPSTATSAQEVCSLVGFAFKNKTIYCCGMEVPGELQSSNEGTISEY